MPGVRAGYLAALVGGLIFTAYPTVQGQVSGGHINVPVLCGLVLFTLCLWRIVRGTAGRWTVIGGALAFALTALVHTDQVIYTLFPVSLFFLGYYALFRRPIFWRRAVVGRLVVLFGLGAALALPFFVPLASELTAPTQSADLQETGWVTFSADPLGFVAPSPFTPWGAAVAPAFSRTVLGTNTVEGTAYMGVIVLALCVTAVVTRSDGLRPWLTIAFGSALFSLGPFLKWGDQPVVYTLGTYKSYVTLPWAFLQALPVLNASRTPGRFNLATGLAVAVIAAYGTQRALMALSRTKRFNRTGVQVALTGALLIGIGIDYQLFFPALTTPAAIPSYFYDLAKRSDVRAVFDVPWDNLLAAKDALYWQTAHQKPLIAGHVIRQTPVDPAELNVLQAAATGTGPVPGLSFSAANAQSVLNQAGADAVVVDLRYVSDTRSLETQFGPPVYRDSEVAVFIVPRVAQSPGFFGTLSADGQTLYVYAPADGLLTIDATGGPDASSLPLLSVDGRTAGLLNKPIWLTRGYHTLNVAVIGSTALALAGATPFVPEVAARPFALGHVLTLRDAAVTQTNGALRVVTAWHAVQPLDGDFHIFVHLVNASGQTVAQYDSQPGQGAYTTSQWTANQDWTEVDDLSLTAIPSGTYRLQVGWYSYPDMQRVAVYGDTPDAQNGLIDLGDVRIGPVERF